MIKLASWLGIALRKNRNRFYVALFLSFSLGSAFYFHLNFNLLDFEELQYDKGALDTAFDWRLRAPSADQRFLIVEIDEASLAYFSEPYGRWPWPRHVFAEALAGISFLNPSSITFNIMFSDPKGTSRSCRDDIVVPVGATRLTAPARGTTISGRGTYSGGVDEGYHIGVC